MARSKSARLPAAALEAAAGAGAEFTAAGSPCGLDSAWEDRESELTSTRCCSSDYATQKC
jgi:hypothetical protein